MLEDLLHESRMGIENTRSRRSSSGSFLLQASASFSACRLIGSPLKCLQQDQTLVEAKPPKPRLNPSYQRANDTSLSHACFRAATEDEGELCLGRLLGCTDSYGSSAEISYELFCMLREMNGRERRRRRRRRRRHQRAMDFFVGRRSLLEIPVIVRVHAVRPRWVDDARQDHSESGCIHLMDVRRPASQRKRVKGRKTHEERGRLKSSLSPPLELWMQAMRGKRICQRPTGENLRMLLRPGALGGGRVKPHLRRWTLEKKRGPQDRERNRRTRKV